MSKAKPLTPLQFQREMGVSRETLSRLETYAALLVKWNRAINLVAADSLADLWRRHMVDSAQLMRLLPLPSQTHPGKGRLRIVDLGSGAGFPGMVLSILDCGEIHLVESDRRKVQFLREVSRETGAKPTLHLCRIEDLSPLSADVVVARALAPLDRLLDYVAMHLAPAGLALLPKGRGLVAELEAAARLWAFTSRRHRSLSDPEGSILELSALHRREGSKA